MSPNVYRILREKYFVCFRLLIFSIAVGLCFFYKHNEKYTDIHNIFKYSHKTLSFRPGSTKKMASQGGAYFKLAEWG